ncbi:centrosomal protein of 290 kDa [Nilaparvata lugens]|uniref:centrosomal protein of 290 kDa n=1 Tax=Nilaparvata lugens TaxID=108931 RepID=UPI00193C9F90|nr:centrosomal protein of 290 kDa [Nilaparvata lugens]
MVLSEWDKILSASPQDLSEQDKEEFFEKLAWTDVDINLSHDNVIQLLRISQEILKYKGEQVEYLVNELDTLAAVQSDDTGGKRNISDHADVSHKNYDTNSEELARAQIKNEELYAELQEKERDFLNEKRQVEKLTEQITVLEQEKNEVQRELAALQRETRELQEGRMRSSSPDMASEKVQELTEAVRQKNKHITQLLSDIETIERENTILKEKLSSVKDELEDATHQMTKLAGDSTSLHHTVKEQQLQIDELEEQNVALRRQVSELVADKHNTDDQLDQLGLALDSRLLQWQDLLEKKDAELRELKQQLALSSSQTPVLQLDSHAKQIAALTQAIEKREDQVEDLQKKLVQATDDLNKSANVLEEYKEKLKEKNLRNGSKEPEVVRELQKQVSDLKSRLSIMEQSVEDAEKEAQAKAEEVSNLIIQLREYESGEFGLNEAMEQVRELRQQKAVRDRHIEQLVQAGNQLQEEANQLEEENLALRDKLGLDVESVVRIEGVIARRQRDQNKIEELSRQVENANDSQIQLKLENRELNKTITSLQDKLKDLGLQTKIELVLPSIPEKIDADNEKEEAQARLKEMIDENEALRKGMHEILDSIRSHDASSLIHIESEGLERLLEALDSRHVSGWYHPAMRLQAQLNTLYGINAALREQLHISRENETEKLAELQRAVTRIELMEKELMNAKFKN